MQFLTDDYHAAEATLNRALEVYRGLGDRLGEARALTALGAATGRRRGSAAERPITGPDDALSWLNAERLNLDAVAG